MKKKILTTLNSSATWLCIALCAMLISNISIRCTKKQDVGSVYIDTITTIVYDTIFVHHPIPVDSTVIRYVNCYLPVARDTVLDTMLIAVYDSVKVSVPIMQKEYADSTYHAWVSGYMPNLDSICVFQKTEIREITKQMNYKQKRWGLGVQAGGGMTTKGFQPYVGLGVQYNIFLW